MPKKSEHAHLIPEIEQLFESGFGTSDVIKKYPQVSRYTIYFWYNKWKDKATKKDRELVQNHSQQHTTPQLKVLPTAEVVVPFKKESLNEIVWLKRELKVIISDYSNTSQSRIGGVKTYLDILKHESQMPSTDAVEDDNLEELLSYDVLTEEELARRIKYRLNRAT